MDPSLNIGPNTGPKNLELHPFSTGGLGYRGKAHLVPGESMGCASRRHGKASHRAGTHRPGVLLYGVGSVVNLPLLDTSP